MTAVWYLGETDFLERRISGIMQKYEHIKCVFLKIVKVLYTVTRRLKLILTPTQAHTQHDGQSSTQQQFQSIFSKQKHMRVDITNKSI